MARLDELSVSALLDAIARPEPTPGGGSASAIAAAIGASLLMMVAGLRRSRTSEEEEIAALRETRAALAAVRDRLVGLADADSDAFDRVMAAYRLPKTGAADISARSGAIQRALEAATAAPLESLRATAEAIRRGRTVAAHGSQSALSDVRVALGLLEAAAAGATANVLINLETLQDPSFKSSTLEGLSRLNEQLASDVSTARAHLDERLG